MSSQPNLPAKLSIYRSCNALIVGSARLIRHLPFLLPLIAMSARSTCLPLLFSSVHSPEHSMSLDDLGSSAWADAASPGNSPKLSDRDIWGIPNQPHERTSVDEKDNQQLPVDGETPIEGRDVWTQMDSGKGANEEASSVNAEADPLHSTQTPNLQEADGQHEEREEGDLIHHTVPESEPSDEVAIEPLSNPHTAAPTIPEPGLDAEDDDGFGDFDSEPMASTSTQTAPTDRTSQLPPPADDDFGDFGDFADFDAEPAAGSTEFQPAFGAMPSNSMAGDFTEEPEESVWDDPNRPPPLVRHPAFYAYLY